MNTDKELARAEFNEFYDHQSERATPPLHVIKSWDRYGVFNPMRLDTGHLANIVEALMEENDGAAR